MKHQDNQKIGGGIFLVQKYIQQKQCILTCHKFHCKKSDLGHESFSDQTKFKNKILNIFNDLHS